jgi:hypothetical protein
MAKSKICQLCLHAEADKENSHIISKFLGKKSLFSTQPRQTISIRANGSTKPVQDTPKENNIFCSSCEKKFQVVETYMAKKLLGVNNYRNLKGDFTKSNVNGQNFLICKSIDPAMCKLFFFSIVWRCSVSSLTEFSEFKLTQHIEEELRLFLNKKLHGSLRELEEFVFKGVNTPNYHYVIAKPISKKLNGMLTVFRINEDLVLFLLGDYCLFFYESSDAIEPAFKPFSNSQNEEVIITLSNEEVFEKLKMEIIKKMPNRDKWK